MKKKFNWLKSLRVILAILFFVSITALFLDYRNWIKPQAFKDILYLQFTPSIIEFIKTISVLSAGFIFILLLTIIVGRFYCSAICPLGILQDIITRISNRFKKKKKRNFSFSKPHNIIRYSILIITVIVFLAGSTLLVNCLDPYSNYGRILILFVKPVILLINNGLAEVFNKSESFIFYHLKIYPAYAAVYFVPSVILILIVWFSAVKGRLFCNTVCPVGTLLGLVSKVSVFKIRIDEKYCNSCGLCEKKCKSSCIDSSAKTVDSSRCVTCYNCLKVCNFGAVKYSVIKRKSVPDVENKSDESKRRFIVTSIGFMAMLTGFSSTSKEITGKKDDLVPIKRKNAVTPPGSQSLEHFNSSCTACSLCISACPTRVLQPSFLEYGLAGLMQPTMNYSMALCNYDCTRCSEVCPTGAIQPLILETKKITQIGIARFIKNNCVVKTENKDCGACSEHCPTKAVHMVPYINDLVIPEVRDHICIGCGACEYACPAKPYKAIYVEGNKVHKIVEKPKVEELKPVKTQEEFPF